MSSVVSQAGVAARVPGGFGFFAAGKILLPGARAAAARGCRRVRCVGDNCPVRRGAASIAADREREPISSAKRCQLRASSQIFEGRAPKKKSKARARGRGVPAPGDGCGAGGAWGCRTWRRRRASMGAFVDGVARPPAPYAVDPSHTHADFTPDDAARRRGRWKTEDARPRPLPRLLHKGHAAVEAVAAQVVAVDAPTCRPCARPAPARRR